MADLAAELPLSDHVAEHVAGDTAELGPDCTHGCELRVCLEGEESARQPANRASQTLLSDKAAQCAAQG